MNKILNLPSNYLPTIATFLCVLYVFKINKRDYFFKKLNKFHIVCISWADGDYVHQLCPKSGRIGRHYRVVHLRRRTSVLNRDKIVVMLKVDCKRRAVKFNTYNRQDDFRHLQLTAPHICITKESSIGSLHHVCSPCLPMYSILLSLLSSS